MKNYQKGQTLIEALIALSIIMIILTSLSTILASSLFNSQFIKEQNRANKYSQEGVEMVRAFQESNILGFKELETGVYCIDAGGDNSIDLMADPDPAVTCDTEPNVGGNMQREISVVRDILCDTPPDPLGDGLSDVTVTTRWNSSKCDGADFCHEAKVVTSLPCTSGITP